MKRSHILVTTAVGIALLGLIACSSSVAPAPSTESLNTARPAPTPQAAPRPTVHPFDTSQQEAALARQLEHAYETVRRDFGPDRVRHTLLGRRHDENFAIYPSEIEILRKAPDLVHAESAHASLETPATPPANFVKAFGGFWINPDCVRGVPNGAAIETASDGTTTVSVDGAAIATYAKCPTDLYVSNGPSISGTVQSIVDGGEPSTPSFPDIARSSAKVRPMSSGCWDQVYQGNSGYMIAAWQETNTLNPFAELEEYLITPSVSSNYFIMATWNGLTDVYANLVQPVLNFGEGSQVPDESSDWNAFPYAITSTSSYAWYSSDIYPRGGDTIVTSVLYEGVYEGYPEFFVGVHDLDLSMNAYSSMEVTTGESLYYANPLVLEDQDPADHDQICACDNITPSLAEYITMYDTGNSYIAFNPTVYDYVAPYMPQCDFTIEGGWGSEGYWELYYP